MASPLYSIRMYGRRAERHLTGAERIVTAAELAAVSAELLQRALGHERGRAEAIRLSVDEIDSAVIHRARLPDVRTVPVVDLGQGREAARRLLCQAGVAAAVAKGAIATLAKGAAPDGGSMRGAMLVNATSGQRLEPDPARGVRVSRMDLTPEAGRHLRRALAAAGLDTPHVREALALAAKVLCAPGVVAELCWSDDPGYTAGYVAAPQLGYVRLPKLKAYGDERGGRAFFWRPGSASLEETIAFLEGTVVLIDTIGRIEPAPATGG